MLRLVITIRGVVDDETEAKLILSKIEDFIETIEETVLEATAQTTQVIVNG